MSRYIDTEALKDTHYNYATGELVPLAWADIEYAPHIDIVRCKECIHYDPYDSSRPFDCYKMSGVMPNDFCSYGEREGE